MSLLDLFVILVGLLVNAIHPLPFFPVLIVAALIIERLLVGERK